MTTEISHAKRAILQTTFSPIDFEKKHDKIPTLPNPGRPTIERAAPLRRFRPTAGELATVRENVSDPHQKAILEAAETGDPLVLIAAVYKHDVPHGAVVPAVVDALKQARWQRVTQATETILEWINSAEDRVCNAAIDAALAQDPARAQDADPRGEDPTGEHSDALPRPDVRARSASMQAPTPTQPKGGGGDRT